MEKIMWMWKCETNVTSEYMCCDNISKTKNTKVIYIYPYAIIYSYSVNVNLMLICIELWEMW